MTLVLLVFLGLLVLELATFNPPTKGGQTMKRPRPLRRRGPAPLPELERRRRHLARLQTYADRRRRTPIDRARLRQLELEALGTVGAVAFAWFAPQARAPLGHLVLTNVRELGPDRARDWRAA